MERHLHHHHAACDSREIGVHARLTGQVVIIDANPRRAPA